MSRLLAALGLFFVFLLLLLAVWYRASSDLATAYAQCTSESRFVERVTAARSAEELNAYFAEIVDCVDQRKSLLAGLLFDRDEAMAKLRGADPGLGASLEEMHEQQDEYENFTNDLEAQQMMEEFQQRANQGGGTP